VYGSEFEKIEEVILCTFLSKRADMQNSPYNEIFV
jgi:hypothetical protein